MANLGYDPDALREYVERETGGMFTTSDPPAAHNRLVPVLGQRIDLDGQLHDLSPQNERMRLFEPDTQLAGQTYMDTTNESETDHAD